MIDRDTQEALLPAYESKEAMNEFVLKCLLDKKIPNKEILMLRKQYIEFCVELEQAEAEAGKSQRASLEQWLTMWKEQAND